MATVYRTAGGTRNARIKDGARKTNGQIEKDVRIRRGDRVSRAVQGEVKGTKGDMSTATSALRLDQQERNQETAMQRNQTRGGNGRFLNKEDKQRNARNARAKQAYDIKRAFGVTVG